MIKITSLNVKWFLFSICLLFGPTLIFGFLFAAIVPSIVIVFFTVLAAFKTVMGDWKGILITGFGLAHVAIYGWLYYVLSRYISKKLFYLKNIFNPVLSALIIGILIILVSFLKIFIVCGHECSKFMNILALWNMIGARV